MQIVELKSEYVDYVVSIVMNRWDETKENALSEVNRWLFNIDDSKCFVGLIDGQPMATGVFETFSTVDPHIPCWNTLLWVEPKYRGSKFGMALTKKRFEYAKSLGFNIIYLDTISAKDYHLRFGWKIIDEFDKNGEHYFIMKFDLNS